MCQICVDYEKDKLTWDDAWRHTFEMTDDIHREDVIIMLINDMGLEDD